MRRAAFALAALLAWPASLPAQDARGQALHGFLQERFADDRADYPDTSYASGWADLNGDGRAEAFVYLISPNYCGSGGCNLYIFTPEQNSYYQLARMSVTNPPVRVLSSRTGGWRDLAVTVAGGGGRAREVLLRQQGGTYPDNPTVAPARTLPRGTAGETVIAADDRGRPLFQTDDRE